MTTTIDHDLHLAGWRDLVRAAVDGRPVNSVALAEAGDGLQLEDVRAALAHDCDTLREWLAAKHTLAAAVRDLQNARLQHEMDVREHRQLSVRISALQASIRMFYGLSTAPADAEARIHAAEARSPRMFTDSDD
jgi:hypothetical protein